MCIGCGGLVVVVIVIVVDSTLVCNSFSTEVAGSVVAIEVGGHFF